MADKRFKDPVYGYIDVDESYISGVIDTPTFQRLRDISQTSYAPLYVSAVHNRFAHSLGVYFLGCKVADALLDADGELAKSIRKYIPTFKLACLLHDVGHAPFSHTGENYYLLNGKLDELHDMLIDLVNDRFLQREIDNNSYKAAAHEVMSAIIGLREFGELIKESEKSFFARCIMGYFYTENLNKEKRVQNCLIELLNSKVIDVDKLDYLLRDAYMTGFKTVSIDYVRLLESVHLMKNENGEIEVGFNKHAISVIENVIYAHDAERKWIQTHPTVLYETYLLQKAIEKVRDDKLKKKVIPLQALTEEGMPLEDDGGLRIRLLSDADMLFLFKNIEGSRYINEYFDRNRRRHPLWKSETEFRTLFQGRDEEVKLIEREINNLKAATRTLGLEMNIDSELLEKFRIERRRWEEREATMEPHEKAALYEYESHIKFIQIFERFAEKNEIKFDFLLINTDQFYSGFRKKEFEEIKIFFSMMRKPCRFAETTNVLKGTDPAGKTFFYIYGEKKERMDLTDLIPNLIEFANDEKKHWDDVQVRSSLKR